MPTFKDFYFKSSTGKNRIHARMCIPGSDVRAVVQIIHGIGEHIERYDDFMSFLASNGFLAVGTDHLGHGKSIEKEEQLGFLADTDGWTYIVNDEEILRRAMKENYPNVPQIVFGHSMGSFMTRTHLIRFPGGFDAAIISGTGNQSPALVLGGLTMGNLVVALKGPITTASFSTTWPSAATISSTAWSGLITTGSPAMRRRSISMWLIPSAALFRAAACSGI